MANWYLVFCKLTLLYMPVLLWETFVIYLTFTSFAKNTTLRAIGHTCRVSKQVYIYQFYPLITLVFSYLSVYMYTRPSLWTTASIFMSINMTTEWPCSISLVLDMSFRDGQHIGQIQEQHKSQSSQRNNEWINLFSSKTDIHIQCTFIAFTQYSTLQGQCIVDTSVPHMFVCC